jgi:hypothetical protein
MVNFLIEIAPAKSSAVHESLPKMLFAIIKTFIMAKSIVAVPDTLQFRTTCGFPSTGTAGILKAAVLSARNVNVTIPASKTRGRNGCG